MTNPSTLPWGILGTGRIGHAFAEGLSQSETGHLVAVGSRTDAKAQEFASKYGAQVRAHGSYEALLADPEVKAVYICTPHSIHAHWAILAAQAGKHILCEKPAALNHGETMAILEAVRLNGVFFMEAFMYRCHPQMAKVLEIVRSGQLGNIRQINASFAFNSGYNPESRLYRQDLAGGGIMDVGCYPVSFARLIAGAATGKPFANPVSVKSSGFLSPETGVDINASAVLEFPEGILATVSTGINGAHENTAFIAGDKGSLKVLSPWLPGSEATLELTVNGEKQIIQIINERSQYCLEADSVATHLADLESPAMPQADTFGNMQVLDRWRGALFVYEQEKDHTVQPRLPRLRSAGSAPIPNLTRTLPGFDKPISRMVMGTDLGGKIIGKPEAFALFDYFTEYGGNCFDSAYIYGGGYGERILGHWMKQRDNRDDVHVIVKGAHTPECYPDRMIHQFHASLDRLQTDRADFYMLHRDNLDVPVGEFVDALNEEVKAGRIKVFGGSNWSIERVSAANEYARSKGLQGFGCVSNQFSLARLLDPIWPGCISASDPESRQWLIDNQMINFAWSSQSRGFFVRGDRNDTSNAELVRCWYSEDNFQRLERTRQLAAQKGVDPIQIAAAWVLAQPFPLFALIGPWTLSEMGNSFPAFSIELSEKESRWLNLECESL